MLANGAAAAVLETFEKYPEVELVYGEVEWIDANGCVTGHHRGDISSVGDILDIYNVWWANRQWVQPEVFWRRSLWDPVGDFSCDYDLAFDYDYWVRCFLAGVRVKRIPRVLARFRRHPEQKSSRAFDAACEIRNAAREGLRDAVNLKWWTRMRLEAALGYDRYHAGQDCGRVRLRLCWQEIRNGCCPPAYGARLFGQLAGESSYRRVNVASIHGQRPS